MDLREAKEAFDEFREKIEIYPGYEEFDFSEFDQKRYLYGVKMTFIILARALGVTTDLIPAGSNDFYSLEDLSSEVVEIVSNALRKYRLLYDTSSEMNSVGNEIFPIPFLYLPEINRLIESLESKYF